MHTRTILRDIEAEALAWQLVGSSFDGNDAGRCTHCPKNVERHDDGVQSYRACALGEQFTDKPEQCPLYQSRIEQAQTAFA